MNYKNYKLNYIENVFSILIWGLISSVLALFFYRSVIAAGILMLFYPLFRSYLKRILQERRDWTIELEFKEMIRILAVNLQSGYSAENAFANTYHEMKNLFPKKSIMTLECEAIVRGLNNNVTIENLVSSLGNRSGNKEIEDFASIFAIAKRSGGNLKEIILDTVDVIDSKIEMKREFRILISSKQFEHRIMCVIPFVILSYISFTSPGYFDVLYKNIFGVTVMSICLTVYVGAFLWGENTINIKM